MRKAGFTTICNWIIEAWQELDPAIIQKVFKKGLLMLTSNGWKIDVMPPGMIVRSVLELFSTT
jgi:hypothetical protein